MSRRTVVPDPRAASVIAVWRDDGLRPRTVLLYCQWIGHFFADCRTRRVRPDEAITRSHVDRFSVRYALDHGIDAKGCRKSARSALRAWSWGLAASGETVPPWIPAASEPALPPLVSSFREYRRRRGGIAASTLECETQHLLDFFRFLRSRGRLAARVRLVDVDDYILLSGQRLARGTVARICGTVRAYLRFLHVSGRMRHDLAFFVESPPSRPMEQPPRALPWEDAQAILRSIDRTTRVGCRDYALLLTMLMYGMGGAEARTLRLEDIDWSGHTINVRRPKTGQVTVLPLLPAIARALLAYLRRGRPKHATSRTVFVQMRVPHAEFASSSTIREILCHHAKVAGVQAVFLGSHALRHTHATRQVDLGVPQKIVADILGHRSPVSTSAYIRVALRRLRALALPVPR